MTDPQDAKIEELVGQLRDLRKHLTELFDHEGWTVKRCELVDRLDRAIALLSR